MGLEIFFSTLFFFGGGGGVSKKKTCWGEGYRYFLEESLYAEVNDYIFMLMFRNEKTKALLDMKDDSSSLMRRRRPSIPFVVSETEEVINKCDLIQTGLTHSMLRVLLIFVTK